MIPDDNRFASDPDDVLPEDPGLPEGWVADVPDGTDRATIERLTELLRAHERAGRGWAGSGEEGVLVEVGGLTTRENLVVRDPAGRIQAWGSVHDRAEGRMLFVHVVDREIDERLADRCSDVLFEWAEAQAKAVGAARGLSVQQIDTGAFADDERQHGWLADAGFDRVRTWWQMSRSVEAAESELVPDPARWERNGVVFRLVERQGGPGSGGLPTEADLRAVHDVLEGAFTDHFNSAEETFDEFIHRVREDPGHRWDHWWLAEITDGDQPRTCRRPRRHRERVGHRTGRVVRVLPRRPRVRPRARRRHRAAPHDHRRRRLAPARPCRARGRRRLTHRRGRALHLDGMGHQVRHRVLAPGRSGHLGVSAATPAAPCAPRPG